MSQVIAPSTTPIRVFEDHESTVLAVAVFPDRRRMVTGSADKMLRLWDLKDGILLKTMKGHRDWVRAVAVSRDGRFIASGGVNGELIIWHGESGEPLIKPIKAHSGRIMSLEFSPDGELLASGSSDSTTKLWSTGTWKMQGDRINCGKAVYSVRHSPSGEHLAITTDNDIQIWNLGKRDRITTFKAHAAISSARNYSLVWTLDGTRLLSGGSSYDPTIREWDLSTMQQVGDPWTSHTDYIHVIAMNNAGTLIASASEDKYVRLWRLWDRRTIAIFKHTDPVYCATFSADGKYILSGGKDKKISKWAIPEDALPDSKVIALDTTARNACITGDLLAAEELLTHEIDVDIDNYISYANRSFVMSRQLNWDLALRDACKSVSIQPSLIGYISKGIALCGQNQVQNAMKAFDLAFMFTNGNSKTAHSLLLIKAITLFNADQHEDAILRVQELAAACPNADTLACRIVEAYLRFQLGIISFDAARYDKAADHFTAAVMTSAFSSNLCIHSMYEEFAVLFGWDLKSLWQIANQKRCYAFLRADKLREATESYRYLMDMSEEPTKASYLDWSIAFKKECSALYAAKGDAALAASDYDRAIDQYSAAIDLDSSSDTVFANRNRAESEKKLLEDALLNAQQVIELNRSCYVGYQLETAALHGAQRYDEAMEAFQTMLYKLENAPEAHIRKLRQDYLSASEAEGAIRKVIHAQMENAPIRLLDTTTGLLCDREAQINAFKMTTAYKDLLLWTMKHPHLRMERITKAVVMYFRYVMLSHRWEEKEPLLDDIHGKVVYKLNPVDGIIKLQSFCKIVRDAGYHWAWCDTCCIDKNNNVELQQSLNSMFVWYRQSALTIVYLSDAAPSLKPGALTESDWIRRGWTVQEFLAPKVVLFYQKDWTLYLNDHSPNHKESVAIMRELGDATGIDPQALVAFRPGARGAREKLQWASTRLTTVQEDIAYSLFGIFDVHLRVNYGEKKQNALGRLLEEIVGQSGDISVLDWVGKSSEFNSCLPADIISYDTPPSTLPPVSEAEMQKMVSMLRDAGDGELALRLYTMLDNLSAPRFSHCRLHLPCITFPLTEVRRICHQDQETHFTHEVKADGLHDLVITTEDKLVQFSSARPTRQTVLLVLPWTRNFLELSDFADDSRSMNDWSVPGPSSHDSLVCMSPGEHGPIDSESRLRALRLIVRLGQPFSAFLLARQHSGEYKRIASDNDIIAQVKDFASVRSMMDVRTLEIL
ncbi:hypothetical protein BDR05DRAFT_996186 [Suillus weaverae]|nr:hypothetical protein BDR05DRAFT_996186 [Suillus weaverae]